jgi:glucosamine-6-phosphate deaminase
VPPGHPYSFRAFMERGFFALLDEDKRIRREHWHMPDPQAPEKTAEFIDGFGGVDICFGGIGINGHIAFNEPPEPDDDVTDDEFRRLPTRGLAVSRETRVVNSVFCGGDTGAVPPRCVTVGMKEILASRRLHFYLDWPWQQAVVRRTVHGPITRRFPASFLQTHPDCTITMADYVAEAPSAVPE